MNAHDPMLHTGSAASTSEQAERLHFLFAGSERGHGTYRPGDAAPTLGKKVEIKTTARTEKTGGATPALWQRHLAGERPLGVIPLREDGTCLWGVIDIDDYGIVPSDLIGTARRHDLPLVPCRSKSGGVHLFLFMAEPVPADLLQDRLRKMAVLIGHGSAEVFPKQTKLSDDSFGNWLNMPYFGGDESDRHGLRDNGLGITLDEFLDAAEAARVSPSRLASFAAAPAAPARLRQRPAGSVEALWQEIADAAPGDANNTLNRVAFALGGIHRDAGTDRNELRDGAMTAWLRRGKDADEFRATFDRAFEDGIREARPAAGEKQYPVVERMVKVFGGEEDEFEIYLAGFNQSVTLPAKLLLRYEFFNTACGKQIGTLFHTIKKTDDWIDLIRPALEVAETRELPRDETVEGELFDAVQSFCTDGHRAGHEEELLLGNRAWRDEDNDRFWFRFEDVYGRLKERNKATFGAMSKTAVGKLMKQVFREGTDYCAKTTKVIKGRKVDLRWIRASVFTAMPEIATRRPPTEPL